MQGLCMSEHDMRTMEMEYMRLAEQNYAKWKRYNNAVIYVNATHEYDVGVICPLRCHEEMHDVIKEYARVSLLCAPNSGI